MPIYTARPISKNEIPALATYWANASEEYLLSLGADINKMPSSTSMMEMLNKQISLPLENKPSYATVWFEDDKPIGHCNVNDIKYGESAYMHLHLWDATKRKKGVGQQLINQSIDIFFKDLKLETLYCQPYALNPAPNKILRKMGFTFIKNHVCVPGYLNFEQEVNLYSITRV